MATNDMHACLVCGATFEAVDGVCRRCGAGPDVSAPAQLQPRRWRRALSEPFTFFGAFATYAVLLGLFWGLFWTWSFAAVTRQPFLHVLPFGLAGGVMFGGATGLLVAFMVRREVRVLKLTDRQAVLEHADAALTALRYICTSRSTDLILYEPRLATRIGGGTSIQVENDRLTIVGPKAIVSRLAKQLGKQTA